MKFSLLVLLLAIITLGPPALAAPGDADSPISVSGGSYHLAVPAGWDGESRLPVLLYFHGYGRSGRLVLNDQMLRPNLDRRGILLVAPNGLSRSWGHVGSPSRLRDEAAFIDAILADIRSRFPVDETRIWASGFSQGGSMAWDAACYQGDRFDAVFPVAGAFWRPEPASCPAGPVDLFHTHGTGDPVVPMTGRAIREIYHQGDVRRGIGVWRDTNRCTDAPDRVETVGDLRCEIWERCASGKALKFCLHPGGHVRPKGWLDLALDWAERVSRPAE